MNSFDLFETSDAGKVFSVRLKESIKNGTHYGWVLNIDHLLNLYPDQQSLLVKKFTPIKSISQFIDKLAEVLVAYKFLDQNVIFCEDESPGPDLYLEKLNEFIEVKRINNSNDQKEAIKWMLGERYSPPKLNEEKNDALKREALENKVRYCIDKALKQMKGKKGKIFLIYSVDLIGGFSSSLKARELEFCEYASGYYSSLASPEILLQVVNINSLFS